MLVVVILLFLLVKKNATLFGPTVINRPYFFKFLITTNTYVYSKATAKDAIVYAL